LFVQAKFNGPQLHSLDFGTRACGLARQVHEVMPVIGSAEDMTVEVAFGDGPATVPRVVE
jgi:hypothetical protein